MRIKSIVLLICILILVVFPATGLTGSNKIESFDIKFNVFNIGKEPILAQNMINGTIDQNQTGNCGDGIAIYDETMYAQGFKPSLGILTKVQLFLSRDGNPSDSAKITVSIRASLYKMDLVSKSIGGSQISDQGEWVEFDFDYIGVVPGNTYNIVCRTNGCNKTDHISWYFDVDDPYEEGNARFSENHGVSWYKLDPQGFSEIDFCFKTYGEANSAPNKPLKPDGETNGYYGKSYSYHTSSADADNDQMFYFWDFGDGNTSGWVGPYDSGEICEELHTWRVKGSYLVKVKSKDEWNVESEWSDMLTVRMTKKKSISQFDFNFLQLFEKWIPIFDYISPTDIFDALPISSDF